MSEENSTLIRENQSYDSLQAAATEHNIRGVTPYTNILVNELPISPTSTIHSLTDQTMSTLPILTRIGFGMGHIFNDLCAGVWFSYTLLFMQGALKMPGTEAGGLMMLGQIGDALCTPVVGCLVDKFSTKQRWHICGTILVFFTFPMIFSLCPMCSVWPEWWRIVYFTIFILLFQFGWPIVQVSHLATIPEMSRTQRDRSQLTSIRYSASVISNIIVFVVTWFVLRSNRIKTDSKIGPRDAYRFRDISLILTLIGVATTACYQLSLTFSGYGQRRQQALEERNRRNSVESRLSYRRMSEPIDVEREPSTSVQPRSVATSSVRPRKNFLKSASIYQNALLYVFSRIFTTTALVYVPLWLDERLFQVNKSPTSDSSVEHIATVPMVIFISSFISSLLLERSNNVLSHRWAYFAGSMVCIGGCTLVETSFSSNVTNARLYSIAILFGAGSSITMISSLCLIADMIGKHADQSGFVYSAVTFADKLITGVAILTIESLKCDDRKDCPDYYKQVLARACGGAAIIGVLTLFTLCCHRRGRRVVRRV